MKWQDPSESLGYCFNLLLIVMQGFRTQMNRKTILHCNSLQYFLIVDYYVSYTKRVKPGGIYFGNLSKSKQKSWMAKSEISAASFCFQRSWNVKAVLWKYIVCVWPSTTSQGLFECLGMLTQPWITVYSRDSTKGTDLAVERGWSLPSLNLHFRNRMTSYTQKYCNSSWKLLGVTSHLFKFKEWWFPGRASWISLGIQTIDDVNTRNCPFTFVMLAANLTAKRLLGERAQGRLPW